MRAYVIRRLGLIIPTILIVTLIIFLALRFVPGSVIDLMIAQLPEVGEGTDIEEIRANIEESLGLDKPAYVQYFVWLGNAVTGDLGESLWTKKPVTEEIMERLPITAELGIIAIIVALGVAVPTGVYSALRQDTAGDYAARSMAILMIAVPSFWIGTMIMVYPSIWWGWTPDLEYISITQDVGKNLIQFIIPGAILGFVLSGTTMRMTRTMMLEVLRQDYIRTAWAKGLRERAVVLRHALKNALIPVVTTVGMILPNLIGGTVILEEIFALPGMGRLLVDSLEKRDYPVISGINVMMASIVLVINLLIDLTYSYLDPRIRYK